jgi:peptidoglycan/LPS O-acetylase OafA/YrhL
MVRLNTLTVMRFLAAAAVVIHHASGPSGVLVDLGFLGVTFFFALSGFVLAWSDSDRVGAVGFYRNRFARIAPLHYVTLVIAVFLPLALTTGGSATVYNNPGTFLQNLFMVQTWTYEGAHSFNFVSWSISVEMFFYLLFPLLVRLLRRVPNWALAVIPLVAIGAQVATLRFILIDVPAKWYFFFSYDFPPYRLMEFVVGICLAIAMKRGLRFGRVGLAAFGLVALALVAVILRADAPLSFRHVPWASIAFVAVSVVAIYIGTLLDLSGRGVKWRPLIKLGEWSFALYMVHMIPIRIVGSLLGNDSFGNLTVVWTIVCFVAAVTLSGIASEFIEKPLERLLRYRKALPVEAAP